jgi:hypothetical protein
MPASITDGHFGHVVATIPIQIYRGESWIPFGKRNYVFFGW